MKKTLIFVLIAMLLVSTVIATSNEEITKENDCDTQWFCNQNSVSECQNFYNNSLYYTIAKWSFDGTNYNLDEQNNMYRYYKLDVTGNENKADWTSNTNIESVLVKEGSETTIFDGGASGSVNGEKNIDSILFCGYRTGGSGSRAPSNNGVPEFPAFALGVAVLVATIGLVFLRKN